MTKEDMKFQMGQLRQDKIVYAVESAATSMTAFVFISVVMVIFPSLIVVLVATGIAVAFWLYMIISNILRLIKIIKLEKELYKNKK